MKLDEQAKATLMKRELEIKRLIRQMEFDKLNSSTVYKNLQFELRSIKHTLRIHEVVESKK